MHYAHTTGRTVDLQDSPMTSNDTTEPAVEVRSCRRSARQVHERPETTSRCFPKMIKTIAAATSLLALAACATTQLDGQWTNPEYSGRSLRGAPVRLPSDGQCSRPDRRARLGVATGDGPHRPTRGRSPATVSHRRITSRANGPARGVRRRAFTVVEDDDFSLAERERLHAAPPRAVSCGANFRRVLPM